MIANLSVVFQPFKATISRVTASSILNESWVPEKSNGFRTWDERSLLRLGLLRFTVPSSEHQLTQTQCESLYSKITKHRFYPVAQAVKQALSDSDLAFLTSPTGSGKTTAVPVHLGIHGHDVTVLVPRRILAETCAGWVSNHFFEREVGGVVGWRHGFGRAGGQDALIKYETPGMMLQSLKSSLAALKSTSVLILDEFHEPNPLSHLVLVVALNEQRKRRERGEQPFKILCMSATIDAQALGQTLLRDFALPSFSTVSALYSDGSTQNPLVRSRVIRPAKIYESIADALMAGRKILYFSPSIRHATELKEEMLTRFPKCEIHLLTRRHPQDLKKLGNTEPGEGSLLISTVSRTGITHPWIDFAVDPARKVEERAIGRLRVPSLVELPISRSDAKQGLGRLGRILPDGEFEVEKLRQDYVIAASSGKFSQDEKSPFETGQLGELILHLSVAMQPDRDHPRLVLPSTQKLPHPPSKEIEAAWVSYLEALNLVSPQGNLSTQAVKISRLPLDIPAARLVVMAEERSFAHDRSLLVDACMVAAIMSADGLRDMSVKHPRWLDLVAQDHRSDALREHEIFRIAMRETVEGLGKFSKRYGLCLPAINAANQAFKKLLEIHKITQSELKKALDGQANRTALLECLQEALLPYVAWRDGMHWRLSNGDTSHLWRVPRDSILPASHHKLIVGFPVAFLDEDVHGDLEPVSEQFHGTIFHATEISHERYRHLMTKYQHLRKFHEQVPSGKGHGGGHGRHREHTIKTDRSTRFR